MSNEIDWSKAPEGATHYGPETVDLYAAWYKQVDGDWLCFIVDGGNTWRLTSCLPSDAIARPSEWGGTGLPPVGIECEHQGIIGDDCSWFPVLILAHAKVDDRYVAVFQRTDDDIEISFSEAVFFRPTLTAEEIAAEEREEAVQQMLAVVKGMDVGMYTICCALYDAGFSKAGVNHD